MQGVNAILAFLQDKVDKYFDKFEVALVFEFSLCSQSCSVVLLLGHFQRPRVNRTAVGHCLACFDVLRSTHSNPQPAGEWTEETSSALDLELSATAMNLRKVWSLLRIRRPSE